MAQSSAAPIASHALRPPIHFASFAASRAITPTTASCPMTVPERTRSDLAADALGSSDRRVSEVVPIHSAGPYLRLDRAESLSRRPRGPR